MSRWDDRDRVGEAAQALARCRETAGSWLSPVLGWAAGASEQALQDKQAEHEHLAELYWRSGDMLGSHIHTQAAIALVASSLAAMAAELELLGVAGFRVVDRDSDDEDPGGHG